MMHGFSTGDLRVPIEIYAPTTSGVGILQTTSFAKIIDARCRWVNSHGKEGVIADSVQALRQATITIRYHPSVNQACRIKKGGEFWEIITPPDNIRDRGLWMQLQVRAVVSG